MAFDTKVAAAVAISLALGATAARAQSVKSTRGEPLPYTTVLFFDAKGSKAGGTVSRADGSIALPKLPDGEYVAKARRRGYADTSATVRVSGGAASFTITMREAPATLDETVITASRREETVLNAPASVGIISAQQLETEIALSAETSLRRLSGVDVQTTGLDRQQIAVRGFANPLLPTALLINDYRHAFIPTVNINSFQLMNAPSLDVERVEVVRGPGSALYGPGADVGVVHYISKDPFNYQGTSVQLGGGSRSTVMGQFRHAQTITDNFALKITGQYAQGKDWELNPSDSLDAIEIAKHNGPQRMRDTDYWRYSANVEGEYRIADDTRLVVKGGYAGTKQVILSAASAQLLDNYRVGFGQVRFTSGGLFLQAYANAGTVDNWYQYSNGSVFKDRSLMYSFQGQYSFDIGTSKLTAGADVRWQNPVTEGTLTGRNESNDNVREAGAYVQAEIPILPTLAATLAARLDNNSALEYTRLSPRAALVFTPVQNHSFRATYNSAISSPTPLNMFLDIKAGRFPAPGGLAGDIFDIALIGAGTPLTFAGTAGNRQMTTMLDPTNYRQTAVGLDYQDAYASLLGSLAPGSELAALLADLQQAKGAVDGFVAGEMRMPGQTTAISDPLPISDRQKPTLTQMFEAGWKGVIADRFVVTADVYYAVRENFVGPAAQIAPFVYTPNFNVADFRTSLVTAFASNPELLAKAGRSAEQLADDLLAAADARVQALSTGAVGIVQPVQTTVDGKRPELVLGYRSFGRLEYWGVDLGTEAAITDEVTAWANWSWMNDNDFSPADLGETNPAYNLPMNSPRIRARIGGEWRKPGSITLSGSVRWQDGFRVAVGSFRGDIPEFTMVDLGAGWDFNDLVQGLRFDLTVQNVFDRNIREFVGAPALGRYALARFTYNL